MVINLWWIFFFSFFCECVARVLDKSSTKRFYLKFLYILNISYDIYICYYNSKWAPSYIYTFNKAIRKQENLECSVYKAHLSCCFDLQIWLLHICYMRQDAIIYPRTFTEETWQFSKWISTWHWSTPCTHSLCKQSLTLGLDKEYVQPLWLCRRKSSRSSLIID